MLFFQGNQSFESSSLVFSGNVLHFDQRKASLKSGNWKLQRAQGGELIDLNYLLKKIEKITSEQKFREINFIVRDNLEGMYIEIIPSNDGKISSVNIFVGFDLISVVDETEIIIYACHELGHLMDANSLISNQLAILSFSKFIKFSGILLLSLFYYFFLRGSGSSWVVTFYFLCSCLFYFGGMEVIKRLLACYWQRRAEYEADAYAVKLFGDLDAVIRAFGTLKELEEIPHDGNLFSTHPSLNQRISALKRRFWIKILKKTIWG